MERIIARLRLAIVLLAAVESLRMPTQLDFTWPLLVVWVAALFYALGVVVAEPYRRTRLIVWDVASGFIDWGLITAGILATGGERSDLYVLYFLSVLSRALRFGLREVVWSGVGTAIGYAAVLMATSHTWSQGAFDAGPRMGYLLLFTVGSGVLAREATGQLRARVKEEAHRLAVLDVTATVSHDLKNPLTAITGLVEILLDSTRDTLSLDQRALLHRIDANTQQMNDLVSNLLDAELIERGQLSFHPTPLDLNALVRHVIEAQAHQAEQKQIGLVLDLCRNLPPSTLDRRMIERLVANLLSNAVKFTPEGGAVRVSTRYAGSRVAIEVWDSGPDVPAALETRLFEKFTRQSDSPGIGLGLYICKSVVQIHGGTIAVRRASGGGVAFVVELPAARFHPVAAQRPVGASVSDADRQVVPRLVASVCL